MQLEDIIEKSNPVGKDKNTIGCGKGGTWLRQLWWQRGLGQSMESSKWMLEPRRLEDHQGFTKKIFVKLRGLCGLVVKTTGGEPVSGGRRTLEMSDPESARRRGAIMPVSWAVLGKKARLLVEAVGI